LPVVEKHGDNFANWRTIVCKHVVGMYWNLGTLGELKMKNSGKMGTIRISFP